MKIAIVGTGAMGTVYAALFAAAGHEVWAIDQWQAHVDAMVANGLRLEGASGEHCVRLHATSNPKDCGECDVVIIATKAMNVSAAAQSAAPLLAPATPVLSIQNGIGGPDAAAEILGEDRVVVGVAGGFGASMVGPGHAHHNGMELLRLGERLGPVSERLKGLATLWEGAGFTVRCFDDIDQLVWEKLLCNCCYSGTAAITGLTIAGVMADADAWAVASGCAMEVFTVAQARGIKLGFDDPVSYACAFGEKIPGAKPSMLLDIEARRACEIGAINGAIPAMAHAAGVEAPVNDLVARLVRARMVALGIN